MERMSMAREDAKQMTLQGFFNHYPAPALIARVIAGGVLERRQDQSVDRGRAKKKSGGTMHLVRVDEIKDAIKADHDPDMLLDRYFEDQRYVLLRKAAHTDRTAPISIGRSHDCDVTINDYTISVEHAVLGMSVKLRKFMVVDRGSTNGTRVAGKELKPGRQAQLMTGTVVEFGRLGFVFMEAKDFFDYLRGKLSNQAEVDEILSEFAHDDGE